MPIEYFSDAAALAREARSFLLAHVAENSLAFGILDRLVLRRERGKATALACSAGRWPTSRRRYKRRAAH